MQILYEDNHIIAVNKSVSEIVQGDKTGDKPLLDIVRDYLKDRYGKMGNVFCGVVHRLDRPVSGVVLFAKTSKSLVRLNEMLQKHEIKKKYWAIVANPPKQSKATLKHFLVHNQKQNKSYAYNTEKPDSKLAVLDYTTISKSDRYTLLEVDLHTGRHHQIRCQLAAIGSVIKGDLKYGAPRSNPDRGISLHAKSVEFIHPVKKEKIFITAPVPSEKLWQSISYNCQ